MVDPSDLRLLVPLPHDGTVACVAFVSERRQAGEPEAGGTEDRASWKDEKPKGLRYRCCGVIRTAEDGIDRAQKVDAALDWQSDRM